MSKSMTFTYEGKVYEVAAGAERANLPDGTTVRILPDGSATAAKKDAKAPAARLVQATPEPEKPAPSGAEEAPAVEARKPTATPLKDLVAAYEAGDAKLRAAQAEIDGVKDELGFRIVSAGKNSAIPLSDGGSLTGKKMQDGTYGVQRREARKLIAV